MTVIDPHEPADLEAVPVVEEAAEYSDINLQRRFRIIFAIGIAGLLLMGWLLVRAATSGDELDSLRARNETLTNTNNAQQLLIDKLATQLDVAIDQGAKVPEPEVVAAEVPDAEVSPVETVAPGIPGERGDAGAAGDVGAAGTAGATGGVGSSGSKGDTGATGDTGQPGTPGAAGANGADGASVQGNPGSTGASGVQGEPGPSGAQGPPGDPGPAGPTGATPTSFTCTPTNPLDLSQPWNCTTN